MGTDKIHQVVRAAARHDTQYENGIRVIELTRQTSYLPFAYRMLHAQTLQQGSMG
jgi:hypothetical protein